MDFNLNEKNVVAGNFYYSPAVTLPQGITTIEFVIKSSEWDVKANLGRIRMGIEESIDGQTWDLVGELNVNIGDKYKNIYLPNLRYERKADFKGKVRGYLSSTINIRLGITGVIT